MAVVQKLTLNRGNSQVYSIAFKKTDGTPYCIKNWVVFFTVKTDYSLPDSQASLQKIITTFSDTTSGTSGIANIPLLPADTVNLPLGDYYYDIKVCTSSNEDYTVLKGKFKLDYDVTNSIGTAGTAA